MPEHILVAVAWPYANAEIHVGNITGSYLPADIFARYHRLAGNRVLMVSGSDSHGTPVTVRADAEGKPPLEVYEALHAGFLELFVKLGLSYDLFTSTHTENHFQVSQAMFLALKQNGYLYTHTQEQWYSSSEKRFLPDRYVEGECYICHYPDARGDQCDNCGNVLDANLLIHPRSKNDSSIPELRETEHFFLDLEKLAPEVSRFLHTDKSHWRPNVLRPSRQMVEVDGLHGRAITRDLDWGIPVPVEGWEGKCLYVWFEAVIGYLSASIEWAGNAGTPEAWKAWWYAPEARSFYFIGKDNIVFHAINWPAQLIGAGPLFASGGSVGTAVQLPSQPSHLNLPYDVPANEFMNMEGAKISGSRNWGVWGLDFLSRYDPDPLRYYLTVNMPEARDSDWAWSDFLARNNNELVATWGNLANRALTFAYKHWDCKVPDPGELREADQELLVKMEAGFESVGRLIRQVKLRAALGEAMALAGEANKYLDTRAPWFEIKQDREQAAKTIYTALRAIDSLKTLLAPFLPFTSQALHRMLGYGGQLFGSLEIRRYEETERAHKALIYDGSEATGRWVSGILPPGQALRPPVPLFKKLDESIVAEELARLGPKPVS